MKYIKLFEKFRRFYKEIQTDEYMKGFESIQNLERKYSNRTRGNINMLPI